MLADMGMPRGARSSSGVLALAVAAGCLTACGGKSCTDAVDGPGTDGANVVYLNDVLLISPGGIKDDAVFGEVVGKVRCELAAVDEPEEGGATALNAGADLYRVGDRPATEAVGAYVNREPHVFVVEQEMRERLAGGCTAPITVPCPP
jgi:hypothetical protein